MGFELAFLDFIQQNMRSDPMDTFMVFITSMGEGGLIWFMLAVLCLPSRKYWRLAICIVIAVAASWIITCLIVKNIVGRPRPFEAVSLMSLLISPPTDTSFPSGHSATAFATVGVIWAAWYKTREAPTWLLVGATVFACLMAFSRMYLYVHFPTDVLGGMVIGLVCGWATWLISCRVMERRKLTHGDKLGDGKLGEMPVVTRGVVLQEDDKPNADCLDTGAEDEETGIRDGVER